MMTWAVTLHIFCSNVSSFLTLDTIDTSCLVYFHYYKLIIKYQSYVKSRKLDAFEQTKYAMSQPA